MQLFAIVCNSSNYQLQVQLHTQLAICCHVAGVGTFKPAHDVINFCHFSAIITATSKVIDIDDSGSTNCNQLLQPSLASFQGSPLAPIFRQGEGRGWERC